MKNPLYSLLAVSLMLTPLTLKAEDNWIDLTLESSPAGSPPAVEKFEKGNVNHSVQSLAVTDNNKVEVVMNAPNFPGKALQFTKAAPDPRTPWAVLASNPGLATGGKFRFTWEAEIDSFTSNEKFPGFEALLTFVLSDKTGTPFFNLYYLVGRDESSGVFASGSAKFGKWVTGQKQRFEVMVDLDEKTATIKIDGEQAGDVIHLPATMDGLRVVQFCDGTGLANYGGKFTATLAGFKMTQL